MASEAIVRRYNEKLIEVIHLGNLVVWLAELWAEEDPQGRLVGIPRLLQAAEMKLPQEEYQLLEDLVGF